MNNTVKSSKINTFLFNRHNFQCFLKKTFPDGPNSCHSRSSFGLLRVGCCSDVCVGPFKILELCISFKFESTILEAGALPSSKLNNRLYARAQFVQENSEIHD